MSSFIAAGHEHSHGGAGDDHDHDDHDHDHDDDLELEGHQHDATTAIPLLITELAKVINKSIAENR